MADDSHAVRPPRVSMESLDARLAKLEQDHRTMVANQQVTDGAVSQLTSVLMPLVHTVQSIESGQVAMRQAIEDFAAWSQEQRAEDAAEAQVLRDAEIARRAVEAADAKLIAAKIAKRQERQRWLRPLLQGGVAMTLIVLTELVSSLHDSIGAYFDSHTGWGVGGFLGLAILVALVSLVLAIRAA